MKKYFVFIMLFLGGIMNGQALTSPSSLKVKVYEMDVSVNSDCTAPITIFKTASPTAVDFVGNPTFGSGVIPVGKYHCVMFHIDNLVTLTSPPDGGSCAGGTEALDMFGGKGTEISVSPAGATITPNPGVEVDPWIYFSDSSLASNSNNCYAPNLNGCPCSGPCPLTALTIPVTGATHTLVLNLNNRISGSGISCTLVLPVNGSGVTSAMSIR